MEIDNIELIKPLLTFKNEGDFYMLYILKRKKDQTTEQKENSQSVRIIKTYCIDNIEYLEKRYQEIKDLCEYFSARAYIHVQCQNHKDIALTMAGELIEGMKQGRINYERLFESVVSKVKVYEKRWIVDIDTHAPDYIKRVKIIINSIRPVGKKIIAEIPTKNGVHLITERFDSAEFEKYLKISEDIIPEIQKKNPTLCYLPKILNQNI